MKYKHLTIEEREKIQEMLRQKSSIRNIAKTLGRSTSSISREINKNYLNKNRYVSRMAHTKALKKRRSRGRIIRLKNQNIRDYVTKHLKERWSPEQIARKITKDIGENISHEAIYQYIYNQIHRDGYGYLRPMCEDLRYCLRRRRKRRVPKGARRCQRVFKPKGLSIDDRPKIIELRKRIGDWEGDSVESIDHKPGINTLVDRKSGFVFITKLKSKKAEATVLAMEERFRYLPKDLKLTVTLDNGSENSDWESIENIIGIKCYYAHAYHSWERGSNENTNGLIRDYFPKKTDFDTITDKEIKFVENALNNRPRKRLGWKTPLEVFNQSVALRS